LSPLPPGEGQGEGSAGYDLETPGNVVWPLADNLGTIRDLAEYDAQSGATSVVNHRVYDAYGNLKSETNPQTNQPAAVDCLFAFTGRMFDKNTGLQNNLNRWYDPKVGSWISQDPIGFLSGTTNLYVYCGNNPINFIDPSGTSSIARQIVDYYYELLAAGFSDQRIIRGLIIRALVLSDGNVTVALGEVQSARRFIIGSQNDIFASVDHFLQAWQLGHLGGIANLGYAILKPFGLIPLDPGGLRASPLTWQQFDAGCHGGSMYDFFGSNIVIGSRDWYRLLEILNKLFQ
jgi:RHS repeat-associated protein